MDAIEQQIHEFHYEAVDGAKARIIEELSWNEDERVLPFLLEVLADEDEVESARIEAARALSSEIDALRDDVCDVLATVLRRRDEDASVVEHALRAALDFVGDSEELAALVRDRFDPRVERADVAV